MTKAPFVLLFNDCKASSRGNPTFHHDNALNGLKNKESRGCDRVVVGAALIDCLGMVLVRESRLAGTREMTGVSDWRTLGRDLEGVVQFAPFYSWQAIMLKV